MGNLIGGASNKSTVAAAVIPLIPIIIYLFFNLYGIYKIRKLIDPGKKHSFMFIIILVILTMIILFSYQLSRQIRVNDRIGNECDNLGSNCKGAADPGSAQSHEYIAPWADKNPKGLNWWEITWGLFRMSILFTVLIIYISKKLVADDGSPMPIARAFPPGDGLFSVIAGQIFNPENLAFMFLIYLLISSFVTRATYLSDQITFDKVDSDDIDKGGSRIIKAEGDFSLLVIFGAPLLVIALAFAHKDEIYQSGNLDSDGIWGSGMVKLAIFIVVYTICMVSLEKNRKESKSWGPYGLPWFQENGTRVYPNPDTYVVNRQVAPKGITEIKANNTEAIADALTAANEKCEQSNTESDTPSWEACAAGLGEGESASARELSCQGVSGCQYVAR
jgi:hypothetical protein